MMGRDMSFDAPIAADLETISRRSRGDLKSIVRRDVDVARRDRVRPHVRPSEEAQAEYAF